MTTDTVKKEAAVETVIGGKTVRIGGIAKGSGMIHPNTLKSMDTTGVVTYMGSFSKVLSPGIRLGWMLASRELIEKYESAKECADLQASTLTQMVVDTYLAPERAVPGPPGQNAGLAGRRVPGGLPVDPSLRRTVPVGHPAGGDRYGRFAVHYSRP